MLSVAQTDNHLVFVTTDWISREKGGGGRGGHQ